MPKSKLNLRRRTMEIELIDDLIEIIVLQYEENKKLKRKLELVEGYLGIYEDYIKGGHNVDSTEI
jgi:hypothetical protein